MAVVLVPALLRLLLYLSTIYRSLRIMLMVLALDRLVGLIVTEESFRQVSKSSMTVRSDREGKNQLYHCVGGKISGCNKHITP